VATKKKATRTKTTKKRGSDALMRDLHAVQAKSLQSAIQGFKVVNWEILGKPTPELLRAGISGPPGRVGAAVTKLLKIKEIRGLEILINGTPRPDLAIVRFQMRGR
jgi:hypothetical protein